MGGSGGGGGYYSPRTEQQTESSRAFYSNNISNDFQQPTGTVMYVVESGDSLWSISSAFIDQHSDIQAYIYEIRKLNELSTATLQVGDVLLLPTS